MNPTRLIALPGTLLDDRSLARVLEGHSATTLIVGESATLDEEVDRLAAHAEVPAVWLGHSLGGIVALHLARRHPGSVAALVLLGSNARAGRDTNEARRTAQWTVAQSEGLTALVHKELAPGYGLTPGLDFDEGLLSSLASQAEAVGLGRFEHQLAYARQRPGLLAPLQRLNCPTMALSAERDTLCPPEHSDQIRNLVTPCGRGTHHRLAGAGHLFPMQQAGWVAAHLCSFLASL